MFKFLYKISVYILGFLLLVMPVIFPHCSERGSFLVKIQQEKHCPMHEMHEQAMQTDFLKQISEVVPGSSITVVSAPLAIFNISLWDQNSNQKLSRDYKINFGDHMKFFDHMVNDFSQGKIHTKLLDWYGKVV